MPVQAEDCGANRLLDVFAHPPGYNGQTGWGTGTDGWPPTHLSAQVSRLPLQTAEVPGMRGLGTASPGVCQALVQARDVLRPLRWELYPWSPLHLTTSLGQAQRGKSQLLTGRVESELGSPRLEPGLLPGLCLQRPRGERMWLRACAWVLECHKLGASGKGLGLTLLHCKVGTPADPQSRWWGCRYQDMCRA